MPLNASGQKVLSSMTAQYGPEKGERVFYATAQKKPATAAKWEGPRKPSAPRALSRRG